MGFLIAGTVWFWIISIIAFVLVIIATERGSGTGASLTLLATLALFFFFGNKVPFSDFFSYIVRNPWPFLGAVTGYVFIGVLWSICKWYFFLLKERDKCIEDQSSYQHSTVSIPKVSRYKSEIIVWMIYWPFSAIWTILDRPVKRIFLFIYARIKTHMQTMADKIFEPLTREQRDKEAEVEKRRLSRS